MTQPPPPYGGYPNQPPPHPPARPSKPRPSGWWFVLGGVLVGAAAIAGVVLFLWIFVSLFQTDAEVPADGAPYVVTVDTDGDRLLWKEDGIRQTCQIIDAGTGQPVEEDDFTGSFDRSDSDGAWLGATEFDPGSGQLEVTCEGGGSVLIGPAPELDSFLLGLVIAVVVPLGLGLLGLVVLIVTGVLWATRPRRTT